MIDEIERIDQNKPGETPNGLHWIYSVKSNSDITVCLLHVLQVIKTIAKYSSDQWPTDAEWREILPDWFLESLKSYTQEEADLLLVSTPKEKWNELPWDFGSWLDAIRDRGWQWWSSKINGEELEICLTILEWPASLEAFEHIILSTGATLTSLTNLGEG